jgi:hypothetical protein
MTIFEKLPKEVNQLIDSGAYTLFESKSKGNFILVSSNKYFTLDRNGHVEAAENGRPNLDGYNQCLKSYNFQLQRA